MIYINAIGENIIQTPEMGKDDLIPELAFSFNIESDKIYDINEEFYSDGKRPDYEESPSNDVENEVFERFMGVYVELPGDNRESGVLAHMKERKQDCNGNLIGT